MIDVLQNSNGKLVWRGQVEGQVADQPPSHGDVDRAVVEVMASLKPTPAK